MKLFPNNYFKKIEKEIVIMTVNCLSDLSAAINSAENPIELDEDYSSMYSKDIALKLAYLLGVREDNLTLIADEKEVNDVIDFFECDNSAVIVRALNNIRSNLMIKFADVSHSIRIDSNNYKPIDMLEWFEEDFKVLKKEGIKVNDGSGDIIKYIENANREIEKRIDSLKYAFPDWVNFDYIRNSFLMSNDIKYEISKYQNNKRNYPFTRYFNWKNPDCFGNILETDLKALEVIYESNNSYFRDRDKVVDASVWLKDNIRDFLASGNKIQAFIDGENCDPFKFVAMLNSLKDYDIEKINRIVVFADKRHSNCAWHILEAYSNGIEVEVVDVERINESKSLVDHHLIWRVAQETKSNAVDSVIIASSDSDFWTIAESFKGNCLYMLEYEKRGYEFKELLRKRNVFYCYLDRFKEPKDNEFFKAVFKKELEKEISQNFALINSIRFLKNVLKRTRKTVSEAEFRSLYEKYIKKLTLEIDFNGNFKVAISA